MDIYQIFITHNRAWTSREGICFAVLFLVAVIVAGYLLRRKMIVCSQAIAGLLLILYIGIVFASTVFTRMPAAQHQYKLALFWSWREVFQGNRELLEENLLNMILLLPMGFLLPFAVHKRVSWWQGFLAGFALAFVIEICQLVFCRGLFEWDDMVHNGLGCMVGCLVSTVFMKKIKDQKQNKT
ncbi:MAG: VanZ family protein [Bariatricus sp.]